MDEKLKKIINNYLINQPKDMREAISTFDWESIVNQIAKDYELSEEQTYQFFVETGLLLVGLSDEFEYQDDLQKNINVDFETASKIAGEINTKISRPIIELAAKNIKNSLKDRQINWIQNLIFILSGGNYLAFLEPINNYDLSPKKLENKTTNNTSNVDTIRNKFTI